MRKPFLPLLALAASLPGCTHLGTNIAGKFSCRAPAGDCQPVSVSDAKATAEINSKLSGVHDAILDRLQQHRVGVSPADHSRTGERTLRIVLPAHVDSSGVLHDEAAVWAVADAPRWAGELRRTEEAPRKGRYSALRQALKDAARRTVTGSIPDRLDHQPLPPEASAPTSTSPFIPAAPPVPSFPGGSAHPGPRTPQAAVPGAEGSDLPPLPQDQTPRPLPDQRIRPPASAIEKVLQAAQDQLKAANRATPAGIEDPR